MASGTRSQPAKENQERQDQENERRAAEHGTRSVEELKIELETFRLRPLRSSSVALLPFLGILCVKIPPANHSSVQQ